MKKNRMLKIDSDTLNELKKMKHELSQLEDRELAMGDIVSRITKSPEIKERLRLGSIDRRRVLR